MHGCSGSWPEGGLSDGVLVDEVPAIQLPGAGSTVENGVVHIATGVENGLVHIPLSKMSGTAHLENSLTRTGVSRLLDILLPTSQSMNKTPCALAPLNTYLPSNKHEYPHLGPPSLRRRRPATGCGCPFVSALAPGRLYSPCPIRFVTIG